MEPGLWVWTKELQEVKPARWVEARSWGSGRYRRGLAFILRAVGPIEDSQQGTGTVLCF